MEFEAKPEDTELGRLVESTVFVNRAHPAYHGLTPDAPTQENVMGPGPEPPALADDDGLDYLPSRAAEAAWSESPMD